MNKVIKTMNCLLKDKVNFKNIFSISAIIASTFSLGSASAQEQENLGKLTKQLSIMNNIFVSSLNAQQKKSIKTSKIDNLYLAGQGVLFTVRSANNFSMGRHNISFAIANAMSPIAPIAPVYSSEGEIELEFFEDNEEIALHMERAYEQQREHSRQFREQQRELGYELRDLERESRDLSYQLRNAKKEQKNELIKEQKAIKAQKNELEKKRAVLNKKSQELKKQQKAKQVKKIEERKKHVNHLSIALVETLCTYGNSLKALPKDEHVSLVLKSAGNKVDNSYQDKIIILTKRDISACTMDKISAEKLLSRAKNYYF